MFEKLKEIQKNAYVPISHFPVSAVIKTKDGEEYYGVNVEDATTRAGACAERVAIFNAITNGVKMKEYKEINILTPGEISTPCFVCRQMISELFDLDCIVRCYSETGEYKEYTVKELCPYPFGEDDLKWNVVLSVL